MKDGENFQTLLETYPQQKGIDDTIETYKSRLDSSFDIDFNLEEGEASDPISTEEGYFIIYVDKKVVPEDDTLKEIMKTEYTASMKQQVFTDELNQWIADVEIERNDTIWNNIEMIP